MASVFALAFLFRCNLTTSIDNNSVYRYFATAYRRQKVCGAQQSIGHPVSICLTFPIRRPSSALKKLRYTQIDRYTYVSLYTDTMQKNYCPMQHSPQITIYNSYEQYSTIIAFVISTKFHSTTAKPPNHTTSIA